VDQEDMQMQVSQQEAMDLQVVEHEAVDVLKVVDEVMVEVHVVEQLVDEAQAMLTKSVKRAVRKKLTTNFFNLMDCHV
jgi:hypothetical protein